MNFLFVGRRADLSPEAVRRLNRLRYELRMSTEIRTLDWIADNATSVASLVGEAGEIGACRPRPTHRPT